MKKMPSCVVAIYGVPRSGTSWLGQIFNSSPWVAYRFQPLFSYVFKDRLNEDSSLEEIDKFFDDLLNTNDDFVLQRGKARISKTEIEFKKKENITHLVYKEVRYHHILRNLLEQKKDIKIIGIVRHPCAVINSWLKAPKEFKKEWDPINEWRYAPSKNQGKKEEFNGFEKWMEVAEMFLELRDRYPEQFYLFRYSDLHKEPILTAKKLFEFCSLEFEEQTYKFILDSTQNDVDDPYGVFRKNYDDKKWEVELIPEISKTIIDITEETKLSHFLKQ